MVNVHRRGVIDEVRCDRICRPASRKCMHSNFHTACAVRVAEVHRSWCDMPVTDRMQHAANGHAHWTWNVFLSLPQQNSRFFRMSFSGWLFFYISNFVYFRCAPNSCLSCRYQWVTLKCGNTASKMHSTYWIFYILFRLLLCSRTCLPKLNAHAGEGTAAGQQINETSTCITHTDTHRTSPIWMSCIRLQTEHCNSDL